MKRLFSKRKLTLFVQARHSHAHAHEQGLYTVLLACILLGVMAVCSLALDGVNLARSRLWAQRAADAAAISGAGRIARDPQVINDLGVIPFTEEVAQVALHNLFLRNVISADGSQPTSTTTLPANEGTLATVDDAQILVRIVPGSDQVEVEVRFLNEYLLMDLFGTDSFKEVSAVASAEVGTALVSLILDTSGSMGVGTKMQELRDSAGIFLDFFDPVRDRISLIAFGSDATVIQAVNLSNANGGFDRVELDQNLQSLAPAGATNLTAALNRAFEQTNETLTNQPGWFNESQIAYVIFSDGSPTAATLNFAHTKPALPENSPGRRDYVSFSGNKDGEPLRPFRLIHAPLASTSLATDNDIDQSRIPNCSQVAEEYTAEGSFDGCLHSLRFTLPNNIVPPESFLLQQFERVYQYSAIAWADYLRTFPARPSAPDLPLNGRIYTIGYGQPVHLTCISGVDPYDNAAGGDCADLRKDNLLARLAFDLPRMTSIGRPYPDTGFDTEQFGPGLSVTAPQTPDSLQRMFRQIAVHLRLRLIQ